MMHIFGDKIINTNHIDVIGQPEYTAFGFCRFYVPVYFNGNKIEVNFHPTDEEQIFEQYKPGHWKYGLKLISGGIDWNQGAQGWLYRHFEESFIYERMKKEIEILVSKCGFVIGTDPIIGRLKRNDAS